MLRDKSLIPLSRQHQHALALCVRIERASPIPETD
jgi:hemerythrin-like domain-containing protein